MVQCIKIMEAYMGLLTEWCKEVCDEKQVHVASFGKQIFMLYIRME